MMRTGLVLVAVLAACSKGNSSDKGTGAGGKRGSGQKMEYPVEVAPLTRQHREDPRLAEKWDLVAFGTEIATAYSELVDPVEERARLTAQSLLAAGGDPEAMQLDEDFLRALEYGMPPTGGMGMGIDRLMILLTGASIRETILFPLVRPE